MELDQPGPGARPARRPRRGRAAAAAGALRQKIDRRGASGRSTKGRSKSTTARGNERWSDDAGSVVYGRATDSPRSTGSTCCGARSTAVVVGRGASARGDRRGSPGSSGSRPFRGGTARNPRPPARARPAGGCRAARASGSSAGAAARRRRANGRPRRGGPRRRRAAPAASSSSRSAASSAAIRSGGSASSRKRSSSGSVNIVDSGQWAVGSGSASIA